MSKKIISTTIIIALLLSMLLIHSHAAIDYKGFYFKNEAGVGITAAATGNNVVTQLSGDVLKIWIKGTADPYFGLELNENVDTGVYKFLAIKIKKSYAPATLNGEFYYNVKGSGAVGGKSVTFSYSEGTDYQWCYMDISAAGQVGYLRYDPYPAAPSADEDINLAFVGFFKTLEDLDAFSKTEEGKAFGSNEGNKNVTKTAFLSGPSQGPGVWLNTVPDKSLPGSYYVRFNANSSFKSMTIQLFASKASSEGGSGKGKWALYKFNKDVETSLAGTPVASAEINQDGDAMTKFDFGNQGPGQYVFYIEQDDDGGYFNLGTTNVEFDPAKIEYGYNGSLWEGKTEFLFGEFEASGDRYAFFGNLEKTEPNTATGDISLIALAGLALVTSLTKKRRKF